MRNWTEHVRRYFDEFGDREWTRLTETAQGRVGFEIHRRFLREFVRPGSRILEVGAGPGRFTAELADLGGLLRITRPDGGVLASVMSHLGTWRFFLPAITATAALIGRDANDTVLRTGDLRHAAADPRVHVCQMYRSTDVQDLVARAETTACRQPGALDGGTPLLFAARPAK